MEDEIKILENCWVMTTDHVLDDGNQALKLAIKNIIKEYREQEGTINRLFKILKNSIHISIIKDKIKELESELEKTRDQEMIDTIEDQIQILKSLYNKECLL